MGRNDTEVKNRSEKSALAFLFHFSSPSPYSIDSSGWLGADAFKSQPTPPRVGAGIRRSPLRLERTTPPLPYSL